MSFISRITAKKKRIILLFIMFVLSFITLCLLIYKLYIKIDILTNPNYFPPEIETLFLSEINVSEYEVLPTEHIKNATKDVSEEKTYHISTDYESMPDSHKLLTDEFIDGFISRKDQKVTREELITDLKFYVTEYYLAFFPSYSSMSYAYTYYPDGVIRKSVLCGFTRNIEKIYHYIDNDEIGVQKFYDSTSYQMVNNGETIMKSQTITTTRRTYDNPSYDQISLEDYNLFRKDYLEGQVPKDFILTIRNIHKYIDKKYD